MSGNGDQQPSGGAPEDEAMFVPRVMALFSHYPQLVAMRGALEALYRLSCTGSREKHLLEEAIVTALSEVPLPYPGGTAVQFKIGMTRITSVNSAHTRVTTHASCSFCFPAWSRCSLPPVISPLSSDYPLSALFDLLSVDTAMHLLAALLTEQR